MRDPFELSLQGERETLRVLHYRAHEAISQPYRYHVRCLRNDGAQLAATALGRAATFTIFAEESAVARRVQAIVTGSQLEGQGILGSGITLTLEPRLARLRWRRHRRIFQEVTSVDVALAILAEHHAKARTEIRRDLPIRPYCVQLDESDLDFVLRLLSEDGIFFFFEQPNEVVTAEGDPPIEQLVLADRATSYPRASPGDRLRHHGATAEAARDGVFEPRLVRGVAPETVVARGLDFQRPATVIADQAAAQRSGVGLETAPLERHTHELSYETLPAQPGPASMELEQERRDVLRFEARTRERHLGPGSVFTLTESLEPELCADWAVVEVAGEGGSAARDGAAPQWVFEASFVAVRSTIPYPPLRMPKPTCHGVETATVVGPEGEAIHTDAHGRVRVRFPWEGGITPGDPTSGDRATTWLRVAQAWAGTGFGAQFIPRVGSEVLVAFVGGDPDRPIVVGGLYDAPRPYPEVLPQKKTISGIKTKSVGGSGGNELTFEDLSGSELVSLRGARNVWIGAGADHFLEAAGSQTVQVGGASTTKVGADDTMTIGGKRALKVSGTSTEETAAASVVRHGNEVVTIDGVEFRKVGASSETRIGGNYQLSVGLSDGCFANFSVQGTASARASQRMILGSELEISLCVGESSLVIGPDKITMRTPQFQVVAPAIKLHGEDAKEYIEIGDGVRIKSDVIAASGSAASLTLDQEAKLESASIKLNGPPAKPKEAEDSTSQESDMVTFQIANIDPSKSTTALILKPDGTIEELPVPPSGVVQLEGKPGERFSLVDVRINGSSVAKTRA